MANALDIRELHAWYGESHILHGVDLHVARGEVVTLLGRNGAGRTTTLRSALRSACCFAKSASALRSSTSA